MKQAKMVLIGFGEIGKAVYQLMTKNFYVAVVDPSQNLDAVGEYDILLVAFPHNDKFNEAVAEYQDRFKTKATIIFSTVPVGTCKQLNAIHSPVEGKHPNLYEYIKNSTRYVGGDTDGLAKAIFGDVLKMVCRFLPKAEHTEFLKLRSTTLYGLNIEFARYSKKIADELELDFEEIKIFDEKYNEMYANAGYPEYARYILNPPEGKIGGHCVVPNAMILSKQYPDPLLKPLINNNTEIWQ